MGAGLPAGHDFWSWISAAAPSTWRWSRWREEGRAAPIAQLLRLGGRSLGETSRQKLRTARVLGKAGLRLGGRDIDVGSPHAVARAPHVRGSAGCGGALEMSASEPPIDPNQALRELWCDPKDDEQHRMSSRSWMACSVSKDLPKRCTNCWKPPSVEGGATAAISTICMGSSLLEVALCPGCRIGWTAIQLQRLPQPTTGGGCCPRRPAVNP